MNRVLCTFPDIIISKMAIKMSLEQHKAQIIEQYNKLSFVLKQGFKDVFKYFVVLIYETLINCYCTKDDETIVRLRPNKCTNVCKGCPTHPK